MSIPFILKCNKCKIEKPLKSEYFKNSKSNKHGFIPVCKECLNKYQKDLRSKNVEINKAKRRKHYLKIKDKVKQWDLNSKANIRKKIKENPEYAAKVRQVRNETLKKYRQDPIKRMQNCLRTRLRKLLNSKRMNKTNKLREYVGCTVEFLKQHLESQFQPGMTWDNYGKWHIDHIIPLASANTERQLYKLCHYTNLQPLWASDNIRKSDKVLDQACES